MARPIRREPTRLNEEMQGRYGNGGLDERIGGLKKERAGQNYNISG